MNKNKILLISIFILSLCLQTAYAINTVEGSKIEVSLISQEPDPVNPGEIVDLRFKIENLGSAPTGNLIFEILPQYPFSIYKGSPQQKISSLQGVQRDNEGAIILYKIKVDEDAVEREETIDIRYREEKHGSPWILIEDFPIRIRTRDIVVSIESITSSPDPISPGKEALVSFKIKNNADSLIRDLKIKLDLSGTEIPFAPVKSTAEKQIYQLSAKKDIDLKFYLMAEPDAEGGVYKIPINISYSDETGTSYSKADIISLKIASTPNLLATIDSTKIYSKNKAGEVVIKIVNRGLTNIKLLTAKLDISNDFEVLSQSEVYIGNIDSDDYETVEFTIDIKSKKEVINLPLELTYMDSTNKEFTQTKSITLRMFSESDAQKAGMVEKKSIGYTILILIVAIGLVIYFWRRRKKKRAQKK
ncbi:COG1361 S-layer family protein [Candidatus Woesearchaeota archaeon]|nr:COG1361 S-layer family protein [Candidatus Woesearchaeota archaeon]